MVKKVSAFECETCEAVYATPNDAKICESQAKPKLSGLKPGVEIEARYNGKKIRGIVADITIQPVGHMTFVWIQNPGGKENFRVGLADIIKVL